MLYRRDVYKRQLRATVQGGNSECGLGGDPVTGHEGDMITARMRSARAKKPSAEHSKM